MMPAQSHERCQVLVVEDDWAMRQLLQAAFCAANIQIDVVADGLQLKQRMLGHVWPEVVVMDLRLPATRGLEVLRWLSTYHPGVPVIVITAFGDVHSYRRALELGALAVFDKPFNVDELLGLVARALESKHASARPGRV